MVNRCKKEWLIKTIIVFICSNKINLFFTMILNITLKV